LAGYRERLRSQGFSEDVIKVITLSNAESTIRQYQSAPKCRHT
jgi:hypothetical protein